MCICRPLVKLFVCIQFLVVFSLAQESCEFPEIHREKLYEVSEKTSIGEAIFGIAYLPANATIRLGEISGTRSEHFRSKFVLKDFTGAGRADVNVVSSLELPRYPSGATAAYLSFQVSCNGHNYPIGVAKVVGVNDHPPVFYNIPYVFNISAQQQVGSTIDTNILAIDWDPAPTYNVQFNLTEPSEYFRLEEVPDVVLRPSDLPQSLGTDVVRWAPEQLPPKLRIRLLRSILPSASERPPDLHLLNITATDKLGELGKNQNATVAVVNVVDSPPLLTSTQQTASVWTLPGEPSTELRLSPPPATTIAPVTVSATAKTSSATILPPSAMPLEPLFPPKEIHFDDNENKPATVELKGPLRQNQVVHQVKLLPAITTEQPLFAFALNDTTGAFWIGAHDGVIRISDARTLAELFRHQFVVELKVVATLLPTNANFGEETEPPLVLATTTVRLQLLKDAETSTTRTLVTTSATIATMSATLLANQTTTTLPSTAATESSNLEPTTSSPTPNGPLFRFGGLYDITVEENAPVGTIVAQLAANSQERNASQGVIEYKILPEMSTALAQSIFSLDSHTGIIKTKQRLHFENRSAYILTVQAVTRDAKAMEKGTFVMNLQIRDLNDHAPVVQPLPDVLYISSQRKVGDPLLTVMAFDADGSENGNNKISYEVLPSSATPDLNYFDFRPGTNVLVLTKKLPDKEAKFPLALFIHDSGEPQLNTTHRMQIVVLAKPNHFPLFGNLSYVLTLPMNASQLSFPYLLHQFRTVVAEGRVEYSLIGINGTFEKNDILSLEATSGKLFANAGILQILSRIPLFAVLRATNVDFPGHFSDVMVVVKLSNMAFSSLAFSQQNYVAFLPVNASRGFVLPLTISAASEDPNETIAYSIRNISDARFQDCIAIDPKTATLTLQCDSVPSRDQKLRLEIAATVFHNETIFASATAVVDILPVLTYAETDDDAEEEEEEEENDEETPKNRKQPKFDKKLYEIQLSQTDANTDQSILRLHANSASPRYEILNQTTVVPNGTFGTKLMDLFAIDANSGNLYLRRDLSSSELNQNYSISVLATDNDSGLQDRTTVSVFLIMANAKQTEYWLNISAEELPNFAARESLFLIDLNATFEHADGSVRYSIVTGPDDLFHLDERNGKLFLLGPLPKDFDKKIIIKSVVVGKRKNQN